MKERRTAAGLYGLIIGSGMLGWWTLALLTGQMPELHTTPVAAMLHLAAEFTAAVFLLVGGYGLLRRRRWASTVHPVSLGMLLYTAIASAGYYGQQGNIAYVSMFGTIVTLTLLFTGLAYRRQTPLGQGDETTRSEHPLSSGYRPAGGSFGR